jgi:hypothetical protein
MGAIAPFCPQKRNRVSVVDIIVNCGVQKETRFLTPSGITKKPGFPKKRNRVSVVDITVNSGLQKETRFLKPQG